MSPKELGDLCLIDLPLSYSEYKFNELFILLSQFLKRFFVTSIHLFTRLPKFFLPAVVRGGSNPDGRTIRGQFHWTFRVDLQKFENWAINNECPTVAVFD